MMIINMFGYQHIFITFIKVTDNLSTSTGVKYLSLRRLADLVMVEGLLLTVPWGCLQFVIVVFPDHTHYFRISTDANQFLYGGCQS